MMSQQKRLRENNKFKERKFEKMESDKSKDVKSFKNENR